MIEVFLYVPPNGHVRHRDQDLKHGLWVKETVGTDHEESWWLIDGIGYYIANVHDRWWLIVGTVRAEKTHQDIGPFDTLEQAQLVATLLDES